jgi:hypothetical protein
VNNRDDSILEGQYYLNSDSAVDNVDLY